MQEEGDSFWGGQRLSARHPGHRCRMTSLPEAALHPGRDPTSGSYRENASATSCFSTATEGGCVSHTPAI